MNSRSLFTYARRKALRPLVFFVLLSLLRSPGWSGPVGENPGLSVELISSADARSFTPDLADDIRRISSDNQGLSFLLTIDSLEIRNCITRPEYSFITFRNAVTVSKPGEPDLPYRRVVVALPPVGKPSVTATPVQEELIDGIQVVPHFSWLEDQAQWEFSPVYEQDGFYPNALVEIEEISMLRDVRCAILRIAPIQYRPRHHQCRFIRQLKVRVEFAAAGNRPPAGRNTELPPLWENIVTDLFLNHELARQWTVATDTGRVRNFFDRSPVWYRMKIETAGVYQVTYNDLKQTGINPDLIDPRTFQVFTLGAHVINQAPDTMIEVPLLVNGASDSVWGKQGWLSFFATGSSGWDERYRSFTHNLYTRYNYYWLTWGSAPGLRMTSRALPPNGAPALSYGGMRLRCEEDRECPARSGLLWLWKQLEKSDVQDSVSADFNLRLARPAELTNLALRFYSLNPNSGYSFVTNHLHIWLNGQLLDSVRFGIRGAGNPLNLRYDREALSRIPLNSDSTILRLVLVGDSQRIVFFDYAEVEYAPVLQLKTGECWFLLPPAGPREAVVEEVSGEPLLLDITRHNAPVEITGFQLSDRRLRFGYPGSDSTVYLLTTRNRWRKPLEIVRRAPGRLKSGTLSADYVIVAPDAMYDVAQLLQRYRTGNLPGIPSARVMTARLSEIYDEFAFGLEEPGAIKAFLRLVRPSYVLLVGDATYDYRDNFGLRPAPGVPPYEVGQDLDPNVYSSNAYAIDSWYADIEGNGSSPDMIIGRITVRTPQEFRSYFDKLVAYEQGQFGLWNRRFLLLADDEIKGTWEGQNRDELATEHIPACEEMGRIAGARMDLVKVYETEYPLVALRDKPGVRKELIRQLAEGVLLWAFFGHGAGFQLTHERALNIEDVPLIHNGRKLPFCYFGSCGVGRWEDTRFECIAEELARKVDGAIATCGATKGTSPTGNRWFCAQMLNIILRRDSSLGRAFYAASFAGDKLYHLFGEPGLKIQLPQPAQPLTVLPETLQTGQPVIYSGQFPVGSGTFAAAGYTEELYRVYHSIWLDMTYVLPGYQYFRGNGSIHNGQLQGRAVIPNQLTGFRQVPDGSYTPIPNSARIVAVGWNGAACYSTVRESLPFRRDTTPHEDHSGPEITILANSRQVYDGDYLPATFRLSARLRDTSGILIAPVAQFSPSLYYAVIVPGVTALPERVSVADAFSYYSGSSTQGEFTTTVTLPAAEDTILVFAADNYLNTATRKVFVRVRPDSGIKIQQPLVYPNPIATDGGDFTFYLNRPAVVSLQIYTLSGRPVFSRHREPCNLGFNHLHWNGNDDSGSPVPSGIYLYRLKAEVFEGSGASRQGRSHEIVDKFIVRR